jgi:predicted NodU family carbamoyl transferase
MEHAYTGPAYDDDAVRAALVRDELAGAPRRSPWNGSRKTMLGRTARCRRGKIRPFEGVEFNPEPRKKHPGDPRRTEMKDILNSCTKHREAFRPFAPSILEIIRRVF